ncbi:MAG TPA: flippase-like domain-containing protein [Candidatus Polarisedimenticolia bacterium]|nr:flippase-like domain-containing protein [Candidatus Polarisedimenticolia bacterium]
MASPRAYTLAGFTLLAFIGTLGCLFALADLRRLGDVISHLATGYLALALLVAVLSYAFNYLAFRGLVHAADCRVNGPDLFRISLASATISYLFSAGGVSGMTLRMVFLKRQGIRTHTTLLISVVSTMLNNVVLLLFVAGGFWKLVFTGGLNALQRTLSALIVALSTALVASAFVGLYHRGILELVLKAGTRMVRRAAERFPSIPLLRKATEERLLVFRREFHEATALITSHRRKIAVPFLYLVLDWVAAAGVLYACFLATGYAVSPGVLAAGFSVGVFVLLISVIPGGLGIMEASMAGMYVSLGAPYEKVLVALLAYRVIYYFLPFGVSLVLCGQLLRDAGTVAPQAEPEAPARGKLP